MMDENYNKPGIDYFASRFIKSITGIFYTYPEFRFLLKILVVFFLVGLIFFILKGVFS